MFFCYTHNFHIHFLNHRLEYLKSVSKNSFFLSFFLPFFHIIFCLISSPRKLIRDMKAFRHYLHTKYSHNGNGISNTIRHVSACHNVHLQNSFGVLWKVGNQGIFPFIYDFNNSEMKYLFMVVFPLCFIDSKFITRILTEFSL